MQLNREGRCPMYDLVIRNANILDGTGAEARRGDIGIADGRIVDAGEARATARREIDARGQTLAPGFIDTHTHDDGAMLRYPDMAFKLAQGVTTCVLGNCGFSVAPGTEAAGAMIRGSAILSVGETPVDWTDLAGYMAAVEARRPAVNGIALVGHNTLRFGAVGSAQREPSDAELRQMQDWVEEAMEQGACGLSTGLIYEPGRWSTTEEIIELCRRIAPYGGVYATHMRNEGEGLLEAVDEALRIGREAGCPLHISHHKATGDATRGFVERSLAKTDAARGTGQAVTLDMYPYTAGSTRLEALARLGRIDAAYAERLRLATVPGHPDFEGKTLAEVALTLDLPPEQAAERILEGPGRETVAIQFSMREEDVQTNLRHPFMMIGSDGLPVMEGLPHPRLFGTYPRVLGRYVREKEIISLPEAVRRMTSLSARTFGLQDRGEIRSGFWADLVLFDPGTVIDIATYDDPKREPEGISLVMVNGEVAYEAGRHTGAGSGRMLRYRQS
jgi:N-acyl-D-amino-acid deacylase